MITTSGHRHVSRVADVDSMGTRLAPIWLNMGFINIYIPCESKRSDLKKSRGCLLFGTNQVIGNI